MLIKSISYSSDKKLARCEMMFHYNYEEGLKRRVKKEGLFRGDWGHQLVAAHYSQGDWKPKFDELVKTKWDVLFDEEKEEYGLDFCDILYELMEHYVEYWTDMESNWEILFVEQKLEVNTKLGPPIRWIVDLIVRERNTGTVCLVETKFKKKIPDSDERILQPQVHSYCYLLKKRGIKIDKIIWNYIRTEHVPRPQILKNGCLSERNISTDKRGYQKSLDEAGLDGDTPYHIERMKHLPETLSLERIPNSVNLKMGETIIKDWIERARRGLLNNRPLRNWSKDCKWGCDYYNLCQADMRGDVDRDLIIKKDFTILKNPEKQDKLK